MSEFSPETERRALELINAAGVPSGCSPLPLHEGRVWITWPIICRLIEQDAAFRREVSDAVEGASEAYPDTWSLLFDSTFTRFIIPKPKPDPLIAVVREACLQQGLPVTHTPIELTAAIVQALAKRGGKIVFEGDE